MSGDREQPAVERAMTEREWHAVLERKLTAFEERLSTRITAMEGSLTAMQTRLIALETKDAVADVHRANVEKRLGGIEEGVTRLVWLVVAAIVAAGAAFVVGGGLVVGP